MSTVEILSLDEIEALARRALEAAGAQPAAASAVALAIVSAEAGGLPSHGLAYLPIYCEHLASGKVHGRAIPHLEQPRPAMLVVDAGTGFAHPAIDMGFERLLPLARDQGIAALAIRNSYNCGILDYHTERIARAGLLGIGFTHAPASIAPWGGRRPLVGTNPFAISAPDGAGGVSISIDQSASVVAKSEIALRAKEGRGIPEGWAFGPDGAPTTDPAEALKGTMAPAGGYKGVGVALLVELLASAAAGAVSSREASPFSGSAGGPPRTGQFFIALDAGASSGGRFSSSVAALADIMAGDADAHVPGGRRAAARRRAEEVGVQVRSELLMRIRGTS